MKQTDKNIYRLKLKCEKCNKDILVCFDIHIKEIPDYGPEESYKPDKIPYYLKNILAPSKRHDEYVGISSDSTSSYSNSYTRDRYFILCRKCKKIENIKS